MDGRSSPSFPALSPGQPPSICPPRRPPLPGGRLVREFHDAVEGYRPPADARWQVLIPAEGTGIIAHHHPAPGTSSSASAHGAFIDWDTAAPDPGSGMSPCTASCPSPPAPSIAVRTPLAGYTCSPTPAASARRSHSSPSPCFPAGPARCTPSPPGRQPPAPRHGPGSGSKATATPGEPAPNTSPRQRPSGSRHSWDKEPNPTWAGHRWDQAGLVCLSGGRHSRRSRRI